MQLILGAVYALREWVMMGGEAELELGWGIEETGKHACPHVINLLFLAQNVNMTCSFTVVIVIDLI